ncbi:MAG: glycoside hydrolase family 3 N-terminal domain-containing protein [Candidatus Abyssubacteria bacterium]
MDMPPYKDPQRPIDERVHDLISRMTLEEKIAQLTSVWLQFDPESGDMSPNQGMLPLDYNPKEEMRHGIGQVTRPFGSQPIDPVEGAKIVNELQRTLVENTRLGIPAICHEECLSGFMAQGATSFPSPLNFGATWDPKLIERMAGVIRRQMRSVGTHQGLAPVADVARDARWGRIEETLGEDPYLVGVMVTHYVRGLQGDDLTKGIIATLKHFAGYSFSEGGRNFAPAHVGPREFADVFLTPFEMAVKEGGALSVMNAYQDIDGEPPAASRKLLTETLRERWGFKGMVVADYGAVTFLHALHRVAEDRAHAAAMALKAGLDVELPQPAEYPKGLKEALAKGLISQSDIDISLARVLRMKFRLGLFERPYVDTAAIDLNRPDEQELARTIAEKSLTLLKNDGTLPLPHSLRKVAVIGPNAHERMGLFGNYSFENHVVSTHFPDAAEQVVSAPTILEALRKRLSDESVLYAKGCEIMTNESGGIEEAASLARNADVAIVVIGDKAGHFRLGTVGEGTDTADLGLPGAQAKLVDAVISTGTPTVVVLLNGRPYAIPDIAERAAAILEAWFPGQAGANAIVDALFGDINPGGKTTVTFSRGAGAQPAYYNHKFLAAGLPRLPESEPVFPFGHGLSYTSFEYSDLRLSASEITVDGKIEISCNIKNTGDRPGDEVVQLYVQDIHASVSRPVKELKGFVRVTLTPSETKRVSFTLPADLFSFTDIHYRKVVEPGLMRIMLGSSSEDIRLESEFSLTGPVRVLSETRALTSSVTVHSVTMETT